MQIGDKVCYIPFDGCNKEKYQNGIIKSFNSYTLDPFIVYNCNNDWDNYKDYTAALTPITRVKLGWIEID